MSLSVVERLRVLLSVVAVILFAVVDPAVRRRAVPGTSSCPVAVVVLLWVATAEGKRILQMVVLLCLHRGNILPKEGNTIFKVQ